FHQSCGSASAQPGRGWAIGYEDWPLPTIVPSTSSTSALSELVPTSIPRNTRPTPRRRATARLAPAPLLAGGWSRCRLSRVGPGCGPVCLRGSEQPLSGCHGAIPRCQLVRAAGDRHRIEARLTLFVT